MSSKEDRRLVESALFSSDGAVSVNKIKEATGFSSKKILSAIEKLREEYNKDKNRSMEIIKAGNKYAMQLKTKYVDKVRPLAKAEIPPHVLKTLSLIAFHQPIKQSSLRRMAGPKIYDHVDLLADKKLIKTKKHRNTEMITTSSFFPEYFGINKTKPDEIRDFLATKTGIKESEEK